MRIAKEGRPEPVHLALPVDLLEDAIHPGSACAWDEAGSPDGRRPSGDLVVRVARIVESRQRTLILVGPALCNGDNPSMIRDLGGRCGVPVIGMESPRGINDPSLGGFAGILAEADLLVLIGKSLDFTLKFGDAPAVSESCDFVVIDPDAGNVERAARTKRTRLLASGLADPMATLVALSSALETGNRDHADWFGRVRAALAYRPPEWEGLRSTDRVHPAQLCQAVDAFMKRHPGGILVCDGGEIGQWPQAVVQGQRRLVNGVSGTIGVSIPFAIAASCRRPDGPVVAILGDGTFGFHMAELDTAVRYGLPIILVVGNDACWNAEYQIQLRSYGRERARNCELLPSRYDQVAVALGGYGVQVTSADELATALDAAYASGRAACINVMIEGVPAPVVRLPKSQ